MPPLEKSANQTVPTLSRGHVTLALPELLAPAVRPKLLLDAVFFESPAGALFRFRGKAFEIRGKGVYKLLLQLIPHLSGNEMLSDIRDSLKSSNELLLNRLISILAQNSVLIDASNEARNLADPSLEPYKPQIEFIRHFADKPIERFDRFRKGRICVTGSGMPMRSLVKSLALNGIASLLVDDSTAKKCGQYHSLFTEGRPIGAAVKIEQVSLDAILRAAEPAAIDLVCYASDTPNLPDISELTAFCRAKGIAFLPGILFSGKAFIGPVSRGDSTPCWHCFLLRRIARLESAQQALVWKHIAERLPWRLDCQAECNPSLGILGNSIGFEAFKLLVGHLPPDTDGFALSIDLEQLETTRCRVLPHPMCPQCSKVSHLQDKTFLRDNSMGLESTQADAIDPLRSGMVLVHADTGIVGQFEDEELTQSPLFRTALRASDPTRCKERLIFSHSVKSNADARLAAIGLAAKQYGIGMVDERRMWRGTRQRAAEDGLRPIDAGLLGWIGGERSAGPRLWVHAAAMGDGTPYLVPAAVVYPSSSQNINEFERVSAGVGVGYTFREACEDASLSLLTREFLKVVEIGGAMWEEVRLTELVDVTGDIAYCASALETMNRAFRVMTCVEESGFSLVLAYCETATVEANGVAVGYGHQLADAVAKAIVDLLAMAVYGYSEHSLRDYLPPDIGVKMDCFSTICHGRSNPQILSSESDLVATSSSVARPSILVANMSTPDLLAAGVFLIKAVAVSPSALQESLTAAA
jgi:bacteriocin biosynthesis cyclodehydratase domain-containing protein